MSRKSFFKFILFLFLSFFSNLWAKSSKRLHIKKIDVFENEIIIHFDTTPSKTDLKTFEINDRKKKSYKKIFDLKARLDINPIFQKHSILTKIRIAQFQQDVARIVLVNDSEINVKYSLEHKSFKITLKDAPKIAREIKSKGKVVVVDAGHGGKDSGAVAGGKKEKDSVLSIALKLKKKLKAKGYKVYLTRDSDTFIELRDRTKLANKRKADIFISIHANAVSSSQSNLNGIETYFLSPAKSAKAKRVAALENKQNLKDASYFSQNVFLNVLNHKRIIESNKLAIDVQKYMLANLREKFKKVTDGGIREAPFWVLVGAQMPSVLVEVGYITNANDRWRLFNTTYQNEIAKGIAEGIEGYFIKNS